MASATIATQPEVLQFPQSVPAVRPVRRTRRGPLADLVYGQLAARKVPASREGPWTARARDVSLCRRARRAGFGDLQSADLPIINFKSEQVHIARLKGSLDSTQTLLRVKGSALFNETAALKAWLDVRKPDADDYVFNSQKSTRLSRITVLQAIPGDRSRRGPAGIPAAPARSETHRRDAHGTRRRECFPHPATLGPSLVRFDAGLRQSER